MLSSHHQRIDVLLNCLTSCAATVQVMNVIARGSPRKPGHKRYQRLAMIGARLQVRL